jgi:beta-lactamase class A
MEKYGGMLINFKNKKNIGIYLILFLSIFFTLSLSAQGELSLILEKKLTEKVEKLLEDSPAVTGFMAVDLTTGKKFSHNADISFPQASAIKIPILMEVCAQFEEGRFELSDERKISPENIVGGTGIIKYLSNSPVFSIEELSNLMIVLSDNSATNSLIDLVGMSEVNRRLNSLGIEKTILQRKMINTAASGRGEENLSTPADAVEILKTLYAGDFVNETTSKKIIEILKKTEPSDSRLAVGIPAEVPMAFKTGFLNGVSTEWAIVFLNERPYAIAVMESFKVEGESEEIVERLSAIIFQHFWKLGNATEYGTYIDPKLIEKGL